MTPPRCPSAARALGRRVLRVLPLAVLCGVLLPTAQAQGQALDDGALAQVWGQALLSLTNTTVNGLDFTRIGLDADIKLSANLTGLRLGEYRHDARNGTGADIDIGQLRFGRSDAGEDKRTVAINNPYIEFVYAGSGSQREVLGMRLGFGGISGDIGLQMNSISGSLLINAGAAGTVDSHNDLLGGKRWDGLSCSANAPCALALSQIGGVTAGNADGPSRDLFLSVLKQAVNFPATQAGVPLPDTAQAGFWLNWRDRLAALNTNGTVPPNANKGP